MSDAEKKRGNPQWFKGMASPNPKGRPRTGLAFAERIRERIPPDLVIDRVLGILEDRKASAKDVMAAAIFLHGAGYLKPPTTAALQITGGDVAPRFDWGKLSLERRKQILEAMQSAQLSQPTTDRDD